MLFLETNGSPLEFHPCPSFVWFFIGFVLQKSNIRLHCFVLGNMTFSSMQLRISSAFGGRTSRNKEAASTSI